MKYYINEAKKKKEVEDETTLGDHVDQIIDNAENTLEKPIVEEDPDEIFDVLDTALRISRRNIRNATKEFERTGEWPSSINFSNVLLIGEAGSGKSSRVRAWAKARGINLVTKQASTMDELDVGGGVVRGDNGKMIRIPTEEFDELDDTPNSVLFLDELNRASGRVRGTLLTLIQDHRIPDGKNMKFLHDMLFTVAAINPSAAALGYDVQDLDPAELSRFGIYEVASDPKVLLNYLKKQYHQEYLDAEDEEEKLIALRKSELAKTLLSNKNFKFDGPEDVADLARSGRSALNARSLTTLLDASEGVKSTFINRWPAYCNPNKWQDVKAILADYEDPNLDDFEEVDDKATQVLKKKPADEQETKADHKSVFNQGWDRDSIIAAANSILNKQKK